MWKYPNVVWPDINWIKSPFADSLLDSPPPTFSSSSYNLYTVAVLFSTRCSACLYIVNQFQIYCAPSRFNVLK